MNAQRRVNNYHMSTYHISQMSNNKGTPSMGYEPKLMSKRSRSIFSCFNNENLDEGESNLNKSMFNPQMTERVESISNTNFNYNNNDDRSYTDRSDFGKSGMGFFRHDIMDGSISPINGSLTPVHGAQTPVNRTNGSLTPVHGAQTPVNRTMSPINTSPLRSNFVSKYENKSSNISQLSISFDDNNNAYKDKQMIEISKTKSNELKEKLDSLYENFENEIRMTDREIQISRLNNNDNRMYRNQAYVLDNKVDDVKNSIKKIEENLFLKVREFEEYSEILENLNDLKSGSKINAEMHRIAYRLKIEANSLTSDIEETLKYKRERKDLLEKENEDLHNWLQE